MDATNTANTALNQLQTRDQTELLDAVDRLRQDGFAGELSLPQLIVVGDQSSGKSSVLEAISRVHFPCADGFGTSFATELVLRNSATQSFSVKIVPAEDRPPTDKQTLSGFRSNQDLNDLRNFPNVVNAATQCIKSVPSSQDKACFKDRLIAHVSRPDLPPLTLVDLPGFIHSDNEDQGADDVDTIKQLALSYMSQKNSIMLPIVSMENQIALQVVLSHTRTLDKTGKRTLGIITKPDRVDSGTTLEAKGIECAKNQNIYFELGWHVLLNRDHKTRDISSEERDAREAQFFSDLSDWNWKVLPASDVGVAALRQKLSGILLNSIRVNLPTLIGDIKQRVQQCESNISKLGKPHETEPEQKTQLSMVSYDLHKLIAEGLKGDYEHPFFHTGDLRVPSTRRIRSRIRDILDSFNVHMETKGHRFAFGPLDSGSRSSGAIFTTNVTASLEVHHPPGPISVRDALDQITSHIKRTRGCELDGTLPLGIKGEIFRHLCSRWFFIAEIYALQCWDAVSSFLCQAALHVAPSHVANHVLCHELMPAMENMKREMVSKVRALCAPYTSGKTITLNHEYFNSVRLQQEHCLYGLYLFEDADNAESTDDDWSGKAEGTDHSTGTEACNNTSLATSTGDPQQPSKISLGVSDRQAFDVLVQAQAYYHVSRCSFVDNVAVLAIENCLLDSLHSIFDPPSINKMGSDRVRQLTVEPAHVVVHRNKNNERLATLEYILGILNKHISHIATYTSEFAESEVEAASPEPPSVSVMPPRPSTPEGNAPDKDPSTSVKNSSSQIRGISGSSSRPGTPGESSPAGPSTARIRRPSKKSRQEPTVGVTSSPRLGDNVRPSSSGMNGVRSPSPLGGSGATTGKLAALLNNRTEHHTKTNDSTSDDEL